MDIDPSLDLINQFRSMNTNDKDHLINEFRRLSNTEMTNEGCCFFLDLAEWNLNTALWTYYEYDASDAWNLPQMKLVGDVTLKEGEAVAPNRTFVKTWRVRNSGHKAWPSGCHLKLINGFDFGFKQYIHVSPLAVGEQLDISVELKAPPSAGHYESQYRIFTQTNLPFGDQLWLVLNVEEMSGDVLDITEQLSNTNVFGSNNMATAGAGATNHQSFAQHQGNSSNNIFGAHFMNTNTSVSSAATTTPSSSTASASSSPFLYSTSPVSSAATGGGGGHSSLEQTTEINNNNGMMNENYETLIKRSQMNAAAAAAGSNGIYEHMGVEDEKRPDFYDDMFS